MRIALTGATGYTGTHLTPLLLHAGHDVVELSNSQRPNPHGLERRPLPWHDDAGLAQAVADCAVLINTWWVRDPAFGISHQAAAERTVRLFRAAQGADVQRIVHVSITNPGLGADLTYFAGKQRIEDALALLPLETRIVRPAVLFGGADILINNLAWALRCSPLFPVPGDGRYRLRPIHVDDFAALLAAACIDAGQRRTLDAVGPESWAFRDLVQALAGILGLPRRVIGVPPRLAWAGAQVLGRIHGDTLLTWAEVQGLMRGLLDTSGPATGTTALSAWAAAHRATLGRAYHSERARRR
jgi:NADH dehydrogenase